MFCIRSFQSDNDTLFPFYDDIYSLKRLNVFSVPDKKKRYIDSKNCGCVAFVMLLFIIRIFVREKH